MNVYEFVNISAQISPDREALVFEDRRYDYATLQKSIVTLASGLRRLGVGPGSRLGVLDTNSDRYIQLFYASGFLGATFVPLNYRAKQDELQYLLSSAGVNIICVGAQYHDLALAVRPSVPLLQEMISLDGAREMMRPLEELLVEGEELEPAEVDDDDLCVIMFTAGTTSRPKGVMLRYGDFSNYVLNSAEPASEEDRYAQVLVAPFYHIAGLTAIMLAPYSARKMVVLRQFDALRWLETVQREQITNAFLVPTMLKRLIDEPRFGHFDLSSLEVLSYGAAATPPGVLLRALDLFPRKVGFVNAYGQTETTATVAMLGPEDHRLEGTPEDIERKKARLRSIGKPVADVELRIVTPDHLPLPPGQIGEVALRTARTMQAYLPTDAQTAAPANRDTEGWLYTSDLGWMDEEGYVFLAGRKSDMIIRGGENISPEEVEAVLYRHPGVEDVAVVGAPDEEWGERVVAVVVPRQEAGGKLTAEELIAFCRERLASYKKPSMVTFVPELPRSALGKVLKVKLREQFQTPVD
ncbi:MAG: hypothetical protein EPO21_17090 [Chloroflexota bacterium]|nr:MAG: hypothetical protein EPO21_17090 [Chloroflexota bacterium]